jgi:sugar/nucleoside kinase (ribokinase family)
MSPDSARNENPFGSASSYDILVLGHVSKDILVYREEEEHTTGGAVLYASFSASRSGASVLAVTKAAAEDRALLDPLMQEDLDVVILESPETTSIRNVYLSEDRERREVSLLSKASPFSLQELPHVSARIIYLAGLLRGELPEEIIASLSQRDAISGKEAISKKSEIALDAQGVLRRQKGAELVFDDWEEKRRYLRLITYLKTDAAEAEILTGETDREKAAGLLCLWGAREVMVTHHTEVLVAAGDRFYRAPFTPMNLSGRTGRGDTCFSAYLAWRLNHGIQESVDYSAALTSIKMETAGPFRGSREEVLARMKRNAG